MLRWPLTQCVNSSYGPWGRRGQKVSKDAELIALIRPLVGRTYSDAAVSAWANGHSNMPADVLLAVAQVTKLSLDELLFGESLTARQDQMEKEVAELRKLIETRPLLVGDELQPAGR